MDRAHILEVVIEQVRQNVPDLADEEIDPGKPFEEYGASSLDVVEVVSGSLRELGLRIPRTELANVQTINGLVDRLTAASTTSA
jgi:acyl carrier protein